MIKENEIKLFPNPLIITRENEDDFYQSSLIIKNQSNHFIIYKIFMKFQSMDYIINPHISFIKPFDEQNIQFKKITKDKEINIKDKCLIRIYPINKAIISIDESKEILKNKNYNEEDKIEIPLNIIIDDNIQFDNQELIDENKLNEINDIEKIIPLYQKKNNNLRIKILNIEKGIENFENQLKTIKINKELKSQKDISIKYNEKNNNQLKGYSKSLALLIVLLSLIFGAYLAKIKNTFFKK